jgi:tagatose-6-phosphate ketose/aldose isomerase
MSQESDKYYTIQLPEETHDISFAMTSSYTNMMLATMLAFNCDNLEFHAAQITKACQMTTQLLENDFKILSKIVSDFNFDRIVYLGASYLKGTAQESALKMLELSGGKVATLFDTPLGFRHGPKSIIQENVLTVLYQSDDEYAYKYECDLAKEMLAERDGNKLLIVRNNHTEDIDTDYMIEFNTPSFESDVYLNFVYIVVGQIIALKKSISLGISADNPCPSGAVNRVVQGVQIYNY